MSQLKLEPTSLEELQDSYDRLYQGWMGEHKNINQANQMLDLLEVEAGKNFIDIGCGTGYVLELVARRGLHAYGVDISNVALQMARKALEAPKVFMGAGELLPLPSHSFDYVMILGSLEHFLNPGEAVQETARILKKNGKAAILVPNSHHIRAIFNVYKYGEILPDLQDFERFATRREWERLLNTNGLKVSSVHKNDTGMSRVYKPGRVVFWYLYNILYRLFGNRWIPLNLTYNFIFICELSEQESHSMRSETR